VSIAPNPDPWLPPVPVPLGTTAALVEVLRLTGTTTLTPLPSIRCVFVEKHAGTDPGVAGFRYEFRGDNPNSPQSMVQALSTGSVLPETVSINDRLVVRSTRPDGTTVWLFDGLALDFRGDIADATDQVDIFAVGIAKRLWDTPIKGQLVRDASKPTTGTDVPTDLVAQFNPRGRANATDKGSEVTPSVGARGKYATFLDPEVCEDRSIGRKWTLAMAAAYLCWVHNPDETYIINPDVSDLNSLLIAREPIAGTPFDPTSPATYTAKDLIVTDRPMTGRDWSTALHELLRSYGFDLTTKTVNSGGIPSTTLAPFLRQAGTVKQLYLQPEGSDLDQSYSNVARGRLARDVGDVVNAWEVHGALERYEISVLLAYGWPMTPGDSAAANMLTYKLNSDFSKTNPDYYRLLVFDECGDGHYAAGTNAKNTTAGLFKDANGCITGNSPYDLAIRRRPAHPDLISRANLKVRKPELAYSLAYAGQTPPCLYDGTATDWQPIAGGWTLLRDRLGVRITCNDPNAWQIGDDHGTAGQAKKKLNLIELLAAGTYVYFRLTCVVDGDNALKGIAPRRSGSSTGHDPSPIAETITRVVDARDKYRLDTVHSSSQYAGPGNTAGRDDTEDAKADALQLRISTEAGVMEGQIEIPYLTDYYQIGDRVDSIAGRGLGLRTDGAGSTDTPVYPMVEGFRWELDNDEQTTTLFLSDEAAVRHAVERRVARR
jgi:hypothetical protein